MYVHRSFKDEFITALVEYAKQQKVGNGLDEDVVVGPVQNKMQFDKVRGLLDDIRSNSYKVVLGGEVDDGSNGYFVPVTIIDNPPETARIVQEEQFSPLIPVLAYYEIDEVIERANASEYGLGGSVWGRDTQQAIAVANRLETGTVWVNEIHNVSVDMPFGGHKQSGLGVEHGEEGLMLFTNPKVIAIKK
nr:aldehyde dehydrogenase family protein [Pseudomonas kurunegalensis]